MKKIFFLLAVVGLIMSGCKSPDSGKSSRPDSSASALPDNGNMPVGPVGSGTENIH